MRKQIIWLIIQSCFLIFQSLPSFAQAASQVSMHSMMPMSHLTMPILHHNITASTNNHNPDQHHDITMFHHHGMQRHEAILHHNYHHLWQHFGDVQADKQQQQRQINLNLSSSNASMTAGHFLNGRSITIDVGGQQLLVAKNTLLTSAEYMAVIQVVRGGQQTILLNSSGEAIGGTVIISSRLSSELSGLVVPQGVTVIDLTSSGNLNLSGGIVDSGNLYVTSFNPTLNSITINTNDVSVLSHGTLSDVVSAGTLPWLSRADANLNFNVDSANNINNAGTILSGGNLTLSAGSSGSISNTGLIQSMHGDINVPAPASATGQTLNVQSAGGTWQATNGNINIGYAAGASTSANQSLNLNLTDGNYLSQQLNINLGGGSLAANVQNVTGVVNVNAGEAKLLSSTPDLQIGNWNITGDPTIVNDNNITLTGNIITNGAALTIVSGHNVSSFNPITINTSSGISSGGNINIIAGATFTPDPYTSGNINILGASVTGGSINLNLISNGINTQSTSVNGAGGNVVLAAFAGGAAGSGAINLSSSSTISTGGSGNGSPGHVFVVAGANTGSASSPGISIGTINTVSSSESGGPGASGLAGGHIVLTTEQPNASINNPWTIDPSNGTSLVGGPLGGATADAPISVAGITTGGGQVIVFSGLGITVGNNSTVGTNVISTVPAAGTTFPGGAVSLIANAYGSTSSSVNTDIVVNGNIVTSGPSANSGSPESGDVVAMTTGNVNVGNITTSNVSTTGSSTGGSVYIVAGSTNTLGIINVGNINTSSQNAQSGTVELISMGTAGSGTGTVNIGSINTSSSNASGAPITISSPGSITVTGAVDSHGGNGEGGSLFIGSGAQSGVAISVANGSTINTSGTTGNGTGGVYLLAGNAADVINHGTISGGTPQMISAYNPTVSSITGGAGTINIQIGVSFAQYSPGGYSQINDQVGTPGGVTIIVNNANDDPNVIVPIVSLNSTLTVLGAPGSTSIIELSNIVGTSAAYSLLSPNGISVGSSNATLFASPALANNIGLIASNHGTVNVNNSGGGAAQRMVVGLAASASGPLSVLNNSSLTISNTVSASSVTLEAGFVLGLVLNGSVSSASTITLIGAGSNSISINQSLPGTVGGATLNLVNINTAGTSDTLNSDVAYLNVDTYASSTVGVNNANNVNVSVLQSGSFTLSSGGQINITGPSAATSEFSLSTNSDIAISHNITVSGDSARIDLKSGNTIIVGDGVVINASGTSSSGGLVQLASSITNGPLTVFNNGIIEASNINNTSIVGFNSGSSLYANVAGGGAILGSEVNFGNLNSTTLQMQGPFQLVFSPLTSTYNYGNIHIQQGFVLATAGFIRISEPITLGSWSSYGYYGQQQNQQSIFEQLGTRIAIDYTPWTTYPRQPILYPIPLQGKVSAIQPANRVGQIGQALFSASEFTATKRNELLSQGIVLGGSTHDNFLDLVKGFVLFVPTSDISVQTREGVVQIPKGAAAWVMETGADVAIYDLHDNLLTGSVKVIVNNRQFTLSPGKEILLTRNNNESFDVLNPGKEIAYRSVRATDLGTGIKAYIADFSIMHGMRNVDVINNLLASKDLAQRKAVHQMLKNATILADLTGDNYTK